MDGHTASITQLTLAKFLEGGHFGAYIRKMRNVYVARRDKLASLMDEYLSDYVVYTTPAGGMQMPCHLRHGLSEKDIAAAARRADIDILGLTDLYAGSPVSTGFNGICRLHRKGNRRRGKKLAAIFRSCCYLSPL